MNREPCEDVLAGVAARPPSTERNAEPSDTVDHILRSRARSTLLRLLGRCNPGGSSLPRGTGSNV